MRSGSALSPLILTVFMLIFVVFAFFQSTPVLASTLPTYKVIDVNYPHQISAGAPLQIVVVVQFSDRFLVDVGIWDENSGLMAQSLTLISQFTGPGNASFTFNLTAPLWTGKWHLIAVTRVWWQNAWYLDPNGAASSFFIATTGVSKSVVLSLSVRGANASIILDNAQNELNNQTSVSLAIQPGIHSVSAPRIIQGTPGVRFVFVGWSDGVNSNPRQILLAKDSSLQALYRTEFYLSVKSEIGQTSGEGWYEKGTDAMFSSTLTYAVLSWFGLATKKYSFVAWSGDSNSTNQVASLRMNAPKSVEAVWAHKATEVDFAVVADIFFLGSAALACRLVVRYSMTRRTKIRFSGRALKLALQILCLVSMVLVASMILPSAHGQPLQPRASIVRIGDAHWYYWNQSESDTCILWLGGGIFDESTQGYYSYWINPYDYESFGTVSFLQDLAKYYCLVALQEGSVEAFNPAANRTIHQELIQSQSSVLEQVHDWIREQGYHHTFLVGYSVGAQAAAMEAAYRDPEDWTSQDGLVLITVPIAKSIIGNAYRIRSNLLFLYGGNLPDYEATGRQFYDGAPSEGWHGSHYYHKEFHVLEDAGHEVWTVRQNGAYSSLALNLILAFVERSKALQFQPGSLIVTGINSTFAGYLTTRFVSVQAPNKVAVDDPFIVEVNAIDESPTSQPATLLAYDTYRGQIVSTAITPLELAANRTIRLVMPPVTNSSELSLILVIVRNSEQRWVPVSEPYPVEVHVTNLARLTLESSVPNLTILLDGTQYQADSSGKFELDIAQGSHTAVVQPVIYFNNVSRFVFMGWDDSTNGTSRQFELSTEATITAHYLQQYFVSVASPHGTTEGSGWYFENSTVLASVSPTMIQEPSLIFTHWVGSSNDTAPRTLLVVDSPKSLDASWSPLSASSSRGLAGIEWFALSIVLFAVLLVWNLEGRPQEVIRSRGQLTADEPVECLF